MFARTLLFDHGDIRNHDVVIGAEVGRHAGKHAWAQALAFVLANHLNGKSVGGCIDGGVEQVHLARERLARVGIDVDVKLHAFMNLRKQAFRHVDQHFHRLDLLDHEDRQGHAVHVALVVVACGHHSVDGAAEIGVFGQVLVGLLRHVQGQFCHVVVGLRDGTYFIKFRQAAQFRRVVHVLHPRLGKVHIVHLGQNLAFADLLPDLRVDAHDAASRLRNDVVCRERLDVRGEGVGDVHVFGLCRDDADHGRSL